MLSYILKPPLLPTKTSHPTAHDACLFGSKIHEVWVLIRS